MSWLEDFDHPTLGAFRGEGEEGWLGRGNPGPAFFDLFVMRRRGDESDAAPPLSSLAPLESAARAIEALKARAVDTICDARQARLNWRAGPSVELWSVTELRLDQDGALWLTLHEYETDEYSRWLWRVDAPSPVRRIRALPLKGPPSEAGSVV